MVRQRLHRFEDRYNAAAKPFKWKFTTSDLNDLIGRLDEHERADTTNKLLPRAA